MQILETHIVPEEVSPQWLSDYAFKHLQAVRSKSGLKKAIKKGLLLLDGKKAVSGDRIKPGMKIEFLKTEETPPKPYKSHIKIVYEDESLLVIDKPAGLVTSGNRFKTAEHAVFYQAKPSTLPDALPWPKPVHRLDASTSGLLLFAKTTSALIRLQEQFAGRSVKKHYRALVNGEINPKGLVNRDIEGKKAITVYHCLSKVGSLQNRWISEVDLYPKTGRTHQLRIHLAGTGHPIVGDKLYGSKGDILKHKGLFLAAIRLEILHPETNRKMTFEIAPPNKFKALLAREKRRWEKYHQ